MKTTGNTVLITGGSAGIGFETAKIFSALGNKVIITGRNQEQLDVALSQLTNAAAIVGDISNDTDVENLVVTVKNHFPQLNILVNNAGKAVSHSLMDGMDGYKFAEEIMRTNYLSVIRLNQLLLPILAEKEEAAIVNVTSVVAIVPRSLSTYSASKAAVHSYTLSLRKELIHANKNVKVFELMPPLVNTKFSAEIGGEKGIPPSEVALALLKGLKEDHFEIHVGKTQYIYDLYLKSPEEAFNAMNGMSQKKD